MRNKRKQRIVWTKFVDRGICLALSLFFLGCSVGPDYHPPEISVPQNFSEAVEPKFSSERSLTQWWKSFADPQLHVLITDSIRNNKNIHGALARIREARESLHEFTLGLLPSVTSQASYTTSLRSQINQQEFSGDGRQFEDYSAGFDASWELDFFGRVRRAIESKKANAQASVAELNDVLRMVFSEIARNYFELRGNQNRLEIAKKNATNQEETLHLTVVLQQGGQGTELDTARASTQLKTTLATIPSLEANLLAGIHRLSILTGRQPSELTSTLSQPKPLPRYEGVITLGNPTELLRRRPDVRVAERRLASSTALIGVAIGDLFPKVTFGGNLSIEVTSPTKVFQGQVGTYSLGPSISWPAFALGPVRARIGQADARADAALAAYEQAVLVALEDTENALVRFSKERDRKELLQEAAQASKRAASLASIQYQSGLIEFLSVLDTDRAKLQAEDALCQSDTALAVALVQVYKALGGGWEDSEMNDSMREVAFRGEEEQNY